MPLILILLLAVFQCSITNYLIANPDYYQLGPYSWESDDFRAMSLGAAVAGLDKPGSGHGCHLDGGNMIMTLQALRTPGIITGCWLRPGLRTTES